MQCPVCDERLREIEKYGVMIDICPSCKGVWLDRGELEKIIQLEQGGEAGIDSRAGSPPQERLREEYGRDQDHDRDHDHDHDHDHDREHDQRGQYAYGSGHGQAKPRKRSLLSDLLEGFGGD
jgi:uncharacterized protein